MSTPKQSFAIRVRKVREETGYSQERLASELGVSFATVNRWENGHTEPSQLALRQFDLLCKTLEQNRIDEAGAKK